jgi:hypothetical protein
MDLNFSIQMTDSQINQTYPCALEWDKGDPEKYAIVHQLSSSYALPSLAMIHIDPLIVNAIFAQQKKKSSNRTHTVQTISLDMEMEPATQEKIWKMFENVKHNLNISNSTLYISTANQLASDILSQFPSFIWSNKRTESWKTLSWYV